MRPDTALDTAMKLLVRHAPLLLAVGLAGSMELFLTLEWSFPYCNDPQDGPASGVFGFPFPYVRWGGFSSLIYVFMPHLYAVNLLVRSALALVLVRAIVGRLASVSATSGWYSGFSVGSTRLSA